MRRRVDQAIGLDASLRQSRSIWLSLAIVALPFAIGGVLQVLSVGGALLDGTTGTTRSPLGFAIAVTIGLVCVLAAPYAFRQVGEATRRLKRLREDPGANVRPLPAPFQASLFGPYH